MSAKKSEIQANIQSRMQSGQNMPIETHRGVLKNDSEVNLLDNFYPENNVDNSSALENFWTLATPGSCTYSIQYVKQGRLVTVSGQITNVNTPINTLATLNLPDYYASDLNNIDQYGFGWRLGGNFIEPFLVLFTIEGGSTSTTIKVSNTVLPGQTISFNFTYMTQF